MKVMCVVAMARNRVIGAQGGLPWRMPSDLKLFKRTTVGHPVVMGRKTFESIGKPLPERANIVVTRNRGFAAEGAIVAGDIDEALRVGAEQARAMGADTVMVIGGGEIYRQALPHSTHLQITEIDLAPEGDTRFPEIDREVWREVSREPHAAGPNDSADFEVVTLERVDVTARAEA